MEIDDLPGNWISFAERFDPDLIPEGIKKEGDGIFDISCPDGPGTLLIVQEGRAFRLTEADIKEVLTT